LQNGSGERTDLDLLANTPPLKRLKFVPHSLVTYSFAAIVKSCESPLAVLRLRVFSQRSRVMATERQLEANRANSVRSTGPKSLF
jgi:hypothetical protein